MLTIRTRAFVLMLAALIAGSAAARAEDTLKVAIGQRGVFENAISELGQAQGIFAKHGLKLEILYTQGSGESQQAVISGAVDIGIGVGTLGTFSAFAKGAPIRVIGSSTNLMVNALAQQNGVRVQPVATGSPVATLTQAMSKQIDVGWSAAPIGIDQLNKGQIRIIAHGSDVPAFAGQTVRFVLANADALKKN